MCFEHRALLYPISARKEQDIQREEFFRLLLRTHSRCTKTQQNSVKNEKKIHSEEHCTGVHWVLCCLLVAQRKLEIDERKSGKP